MLLPLATSRTGLKRRAITASGTLAFASVSRTAFGVAWSKVQRVTVLGLATTASRLSGGSR